MDDRFKFEANKFNEKTGRKKHKRGQNEGGSMKIRLTKINLSRAFLSHSAVF